MELSKRVRIKIIKTIKDKIYLQHYKDTFGFFLTPAQVIKRDILVQQAMARYRERIKKEKEQAMRNEEDGKTKENNE